MQAVWAAPGPVTVRELLDELNRDRPRPLAYTTVMTVMARLGEKGVLRRHKVGRGYTYEAVASDPAAIAVQGVLREFGDAAMAHFAEHAREDPELRRRLEQLLRRKS
jgi:predicted transcriptional regulator